MKTLTALFSASLIALTTEVVVVDAVYLLLRVNDLSVVECNVVVVEYVVSYL